MSSMNCANCGASAQLGTQFCTTCGTRLVPAQAPAQEPTPTVTSFAVPQRPAPYQEFDPPRVPPERPEPAWSGQPPRPPRPPRDRRSGGPPTWAIITGAVLVVGICAAVVALVVLKSSPSGHANLSSNSSPTTASHQSPSTHQSASTQPSAASQSPATTQAPSEQVGAQNLATLLAQSANDRSAITSAVTDVNQCGSNLSGDASAFQQAASSRQQLLGELAQLQDASALPAQLIADLTGAWQSSYQADKDFAAWANDENANGCTPNDSSDPNFQAASGPDSHATTDKQAFAGMWNPIASQYGLQNYQWNQL